MMDKQAILTKAIQKAIDNGWDGKTSQHTKINDYDIEALGGNGYITDISVEEIIYSHDFAKALWGEKDVEIFTGFGYDPGLTDDDPGDEYNTYRNEIAWQYHLQQMVIADDPITYLGQNI